jgi:hypothetical protein
MIAPERALMAAFCNQWMNVTLHAGVRALSGSALWLERFIAQPSPREPLNAIRALDRIVNRWICSRIRWNRRLVKT